MLDFDSQSLNIEYCLKMSFLWKRTTYVPLLVNQIATRTDNFLRSNHCYGSLETEEGCSNSSMVRQGNGRTIHPDSIRKGQVPIPTSILQGFPDTYLRQN